MTLNIVNKSKHKMTAYSTARAAGMKLRDIKEYPVKDGERI